MGPVSRRRPGRGLTGRFGSPAPSLRPTRASRPSEEGANLRSLSGFKERKGRRVTSEPHSRRFLGGGAVESSPPPRPPPAFGSPTCELRRVRAPGPPGSENSVILRGALSPRPPSTCPGTTEADSAPLPPSLPPPPLPAALLSAQVPRPVRRSQSPPRAPCTHRDFLEAGSARVAPGRVPGGSDAEARLGLRGHGGVGRRDWPPPPPPRSLPPPCPPSPGRGGRVLRPKAGPP